jgi:hypothetical protein
MQSYGKFIKIPSFTSNDIVFIHQNAIKWYSKYEKGNFDTQKDVILLKFFLA